MKWHKLYRESEEPSEENRTKSLDEMIADYHGDEFWDEFNDVLASYGVECTNDVYDGDEGYWRFQFPVTGYWENDGIGSYEYWGSIGYDKGTDYFVVEDLDFNYDKLNDELYEKFGLRIEWDEPKDEPESDDGHTGDGYYFVSVDDEAKLRTWLDKVVTEDSIPQELRDRAMAAQRVLRNNASLSDSELRSFARRAKMMHRDELAQAAEDLLEYRDASKSVTGDR